VESAIENYKSKYATYPHDNPANPYNPLYINQLYCELLSTSFNPANSTYTTLDGSASIAATAVQTTFGGVNGFVNCSKGGGGDDASLGVNNFKKGLKATQFGELTPGGTRIMVCSITWPDSLGNGYAGVPRLS